MHTQAPSYVLFGDPVKHSLSPVIHNSAFNRLNLPFVYSALKVSASELEAEVGKIDGISLRGANVTIPHKKAVIPFLDLLTPLASKVGAVNTIFVEDGIRIGHNTDVEGFLQPLAGLGLEDTEIVILGAGGAARAVMVAAQTGLKSSRISVVARNFDAARAACQELEIGEAFPESSLLKLIKNASLVVNATPVGMWPNTVASPVPASFRFHDKQTVYDLVYAPEETALLKMARFYGAHTVGGLGMLIAQAAAAFKQWTACDMPIQEVTQAVRQHMNSKSTS